MTEEETAVVPREPLSLLTGAPNERVAQATEVANALQGVIDNRKLYANISNRKYVLYEGWTTLGALVGVFPVCAWSRKTDDGWEARVEAHTLTGAVVGAAEASCSRDERNWKTRDDYALRSMAQTRAGAKALRMPLGFIMALAGYEATPADEMPREEARPVEARPRQRSQSPQPNLHPPEPVETVTEPTVWACSRCGTGVAIPISEKNCPKCGHVKGARPDKPGSEQPPAPVESGTEPLPEPVEAE